jgi:superfamily II DNA or RNA helicase
MNSVLLTSDRIGTGKSLMARNVTPKKDYRDIINQQRPEEVETWLDALQYLLEAHGFTASRKGLNFIGNVSNFRYDKDEDAFTCRCQIDNTQALSVRLYIDIDDYFIDAECTCAHSRSDLCEHTFAATTRLSRELKQPESDAYRQLTGQVSPNAWKTTLSLLDQFFGDNQQQSAKQQSPDFRLVWRISDQYGQLAVTCYEQRPSKNRRGWTPGRKVDWDRFLREKKLWTTEQDRKTAEALLAKRNNYRYGYSSYSSFGYYSPYSIDLITVLQNLAGHPLVSWENAPETLVAIVSAKPGLAVTAVKGNFQIGITLDGMPLSEYSKTFEMLERGFVGIDRSNNRVVVGTGDERLLKLLHKISKEQPVLPAAAEEELLARLPRLEQALPVQLPEKLAGAVLPADQRIYLRLSRVPQGGVTVEMLVRPAPEGAYCRPGEGPEELTGLADGKRIRVQRNLADELSRAHVMAGELRLAEALSLDMWKWNFPSDDDALDFLSAVQNRPEDDDRLVVEWIEGETSMSLVGEVSPASFKFQIKNRRDWFGLEGTIEVGGQTFPLVDLLQALSGSRRYIQLADGQWAAISQELKERLTALDDVLHRNRGKLEFNATATPVISDLLDDQITLKATKAWKQAVARLEQAVDLNPEPPVALTAELRDYQLEGYRWLRRLAAWGVGGCLADDMGLGKTVQALAVLIDRMEVGPTLVVAPKSVGFNWVRETERFAPTLRPTLYRNTDREEFLKTVGEGDVVVTSYGLLLRDAEQLAQVEWGTLVIDEAQFIKNSATKTARAVRDLQADWKVALTGTPLENHLGELWSIYRAISPGLFGSRERFRDRFADPIEKQKESKRRQALSRVIRPFMLRRTKSEVLSELPQRTEMQLSAELSSAERKLYEDARLWAVTHLAEIGQRDEEQRFHVLAALTRLRQLACHPRLVDDQWNRSSAKLELLLETVDELREGRHRALVFSQFTQHLALIREALDERGIAYQYLDGQTSSKQREQRIDAFQRGEGDLFLISLKAGGTGLNLTAADYVIHMDPWWNPAVEDQATDRAHRIGQTRPVMVYRLVAKDTIEEQILNLHAEKRNLVAGVLEGSDQAAKLTTEELIQLIRGDEAASIAAGKK